MKSDTKLYIKIKYRNSYKLENRSYLVLCMWLIIFQYYWDRIIIIIVFLKVIYDDN